VAQEVEIHRTARRADYAYKIGRHLQEQAHRRHFEHLRMNGDKHAGGGGRRAKREEAKLRRAVDHDHTMPVGHAGKRHRDAREKRHVERGTVKSIPALPCFAPLPAHERGFGRGATFFNPWHYVPVLARKPGALRNGAPFKDWVLPVGLQRMPRLFEDLALARLDGRFPRLVDRLARVQLLVLDDWGTHTLKDQQRLDLLEIFEERYKRKSTLITAQLPVARWHDMIGEPTIADAILDRIVHNAHRIQLKGDSMRKQKNPPLDAKPERRNQTHETETGAGKTGAPNVVRDLVK
jgi:hypothetical protein